ncbi:hypothetical protein NXX42_22390 [Bacteroides thetaiotaomicron]|nr:hypothetical protein [Bacteroides thetaiotaomicron]
MMTTSPENHSEKERETVVAGEVKVQSVHQHNGVRSGCKSARIGRNCQVSRSGWIEAVTNGTQTKRVWYRRGEYQRSGDKRRNGVSGCCHVPVRQKEKGQKGKRKEPGLSEKRTAAFHEWLVLQKDMAQPKERDKCKKECGRAGVEGYPVPACIIKILP